MPINSSPDDSGEKYIFREKKNDKVIGVKMLTFDLGIKYLGILCAIFATFFNSKISSE